MHVEQSNVYPLVCLSAGSALLGPQHGTLTSSWVPQPSECPESHRALPELPLTIVGGGKRQAFWTQHRVGDLLRPAAKGHLEGYPMAPV